MITGVTLTFPIGAAFGADGNLYVSNSGNDRVLRYKGVTGPFLNTLVHLPEAASRTPGDYLWA